MKLPDKYNVLIITLSDRASKGEYEDLSGPRIGTIIEEFFRSGGSEFSVTYKLIPDDPEILRGSIMGAYESYNIIFTTGGTGIGPRDITPDTVKPLLSKELPGIMEYIRIKYGADKPNALLSRSIAGIIGKCLIYTLPGSVRAVSEYMNEIIKTLDHTFMMLYGIDSHK